MKNLWQWGPVIKLLFNVACLERLVQYHRLFVGYSGGLDSTVLLHALSTHAKLQSKLIAIHVNHGLSPHALQWEAHCQKFCDSLNIPLIIKKIHDLQGGNREETARNARYQIFENLMANEDCLLLGHHQNDQAETVLLHLLRGTGVDGLAGMPEVKPFAKGELVRPLLSQPRSALSAYANLAQLPWVEDESNENTQFSRNFIRHAVLPLLISRWPQTIKNLSSMAKHCQQAQLNLKDLALLDCQNLFQSKQKLGIRGLTHLGKARLTNVLREWLKVNQIKRPPVSTFNRIIEELINGKPDANSEVAWGEHRIKCYKENLYLLQIKQPKRSCRHWNQFPEPIQLEHVGNLEATLKTEGLFIPPDSSIEIRFRQGGETFCWHNQTKSLKKLFQEWQIPPWVRQLIPLIYVNQQLACIVGYAISDKFYNANTGYEVVLKPEVSIPDD